MVNLDNLNDNQREAATFMDGPCLVIAAAGAGKTSTLVSRVANLIDKGVNERSILLLTFTNKAANEMKNRACKILEKDTIDLTACTYHSFCVQYLRKYASLLSLNASFTIIDGTDAGEVMKLLKEEKGYNEEAKFPTHKALINIFSTSINKEMSIDDVVKIVYPDYERFLKEIKELKQSYIDYKMDKNILDYDDILTLFLTLIKNNPPICKKISDAFEYIMVDEYQDSNRLQLEILLELRKFSNKNIMVVGDDQQCIPVGTKIETGDGFKNIEEITTSDFVKVAKGGRKYTFVKPDEILQKDFNGKLIKITTKKGFSISATENHIVFVRRDSSYSVKDNLTLTLFGDKERKTKVFPTDEDYLSSLVYETSDKDDIFIDSLWDKRTFHKDGINFRQGLCLTVDVDALEKFAGYVLEKRDIPFIKKARLTFREFDFLPIGEVTLGMNICACKDDEIFEDEVVSISEIPYEGKVYDINISKYRNYFANGICVHNCIYGFRGSKFDNIMHFPDEFVDTKVIVLDENYRSNQEILDVANVVIDKAKEKYPKTLKATYKSGRKPLLVECYNSEEEARYILDEIEKLLCPPYNYEMKDIAVLIRNSKDSYMLESLLTKNYYSYEKYGGIKFLEKSFIKDIFSFLKVSVNEKDELAWFRLLQLYPNIGIVHAKKLTESIIKNGVDELLDDKYNGRKYSEYFEDIYEKVNYLKGLNIGDQLDYLIDTYYFTLLETKIKSSRMSANKKNELLSELKENKDEALILKEFATGYTSTLKFLTDLTLEVPEKSNTDEKIIISTVHSAKGLEWKAVFILNCVNGSFPSPSRIAPKSKKAIEWIEGEEEEERRIFYVAVTRAKEFLYLTYPKVKFGYDGSPERTELSDFIDKDLRAKVTFDIKERTTWMW